MFVYPPVFGCRRKACPPPTPAALRQLLARLKETGSLKQKLADANKKVQSALTPQPQARTQARAQTREGEDGSDERPREQALSPDSVAAAGGASAGETADAEAA